jgi:type I restriction enzyme S subunit
MSEMRKELPDGWRLVKLGDVAQLINGRAYQANELLASGKYPVLRVGNLFTSNHWYYSDLELDDDKYIDTGDLIYAWSASFGPFIWSGPKVIFHYHIWKILCSDQLHREYAKCALEVLTSQIKQQSHGVGMLHMTKEKMEQFHLPLPPLPEQRRIAALLREQMVAVGKARVAATERLAAIKALSGAYLREVFPQDDQSLPPGWRFSMLGELCERSGQYGTSVKSNTEGKGLPVLGMYHIHEGHIRWEKLAHVELPNHEMARYLLKRGDLLFNRTNSAELVGKTAVYDRDEPAVFASYLIRFQPAKDKANPHFISAYINSRFGRAFIERNMGRAIGQVNVSASTMFNMPIPHPQLNEQRRIAALLREQIAAAEKVRAAVEEELNAINALPAALLRRAFSGEV